MLYDVIMQGVSVYKLTVCVKLYEKCEWNIKELEVPAVKITNW